MVTETNGRATIKPAPGRCLSIKDVQHETSLSRATIYRRIAAQTFPSPRSTGGGRVVWIERDIEAWKRQIAGDSAP